LQYIFVSDAANMIVDYWILHCFVQKFWFIGFVCSVFHRKRKSCGFSK